MRFRTESMPTAAALMSQKDFSVYFLELELVSETSHKGYQEERFDFILEIGATEQQFNEWKSKYVNRLATIEPITYDASLNILRDSLKIHRRRNKSNKN